MLNPFLYVIAAVLVLYVLIHTLREKKFSNSDALAALGVVFSLIIARGPTFINQADLSAQTGTGNQASAFVTTTTPTPAPTPAPAAPPAAPTVPVFEGAVGQFEEGEAFLQFLSGHANQIVRFDASISSEDFHGDNSDADSFMVIWEQCEDLDPGEKPSSAKCTGTEIGVKSLDESPGIGYFRGDYQLKGYFVVGEIGGPHQGLMGLILKPLRTEDVLLRQLK